MNFPVLIIGGDSRVGSICQSLLPGALSTSRRNGAECFFDLCRVEECLASMPTAAKVIICAGLVGEQACQSSPGLAIQLNVEAAGVITEFFAKRGAEVTYISTDIAEVDLGHYASSKLAGERAVMSMGGRVLRLGKLLLQGYPDVFVTWEGHLSRNESIAAFTNRFLAPIASADLARGLFAFMVRNDPFATLSAKRYVSYYDAALAISRLAGSSAPVLPVTAGVTPAPVASVPVWFSAPDPIDVIIEHVSKLRERR